jgi:hypothetical protein
MSARLLNRDRSTASVLITPTWLGRLFGRRPYVIRCERNEYGEWRTEATKRRVSVGVLDALDREEVGADLPVARIEAKR